MDNIFKVIYAVFMKLWWLFNIYKDNLPLDFFIFLYENIRSKWTSFFENSTGVPWRYCLIKISSTSLQIRVGGKCSIQYVLWPSSSNCRYLFWKQSTFFIIVNGLHSLNFVLDLLTVSLQFTCVQENIIVLRFKTIIEERIHVITRWTIYTSSVFSCY